MKTLEGYKETQQLYETRDEIVYRGHRNENNQSVILKLLKKDYPPPQEIARLQREFDLIKQFKGKGVIEAISLDKHDNSYVLVMDDFSGELLTTILDRDGAVTIAQFFSIALKLTDVLGHIHKAGIVHNDINPKHIIWNKQSNDIRLIDCNTASQLSFENPSIANPNMLEGTLEYMSPEQTGRMNRTVDYRSDFYSLGATFYKILTGHTPFETTDLTELVHSHIAKKPADLSTFGDHFPALLNEIILKLMAKNAEDRYQSCLGLKKDLLYCQKVLAGIIPLSSTRHKIGQNDIPQRFSISQKIYAREHETKTLLNSFERVATGAKELMLVAGYSGIGKSVIVNEIHKSIVAKRGLFISGKFDQFKRDIPYLPLIQAFQKLIRQLLAEDEDSIEVWKRLILEKVETKGQIIAEVLPDIELIIGPQPAVPELPAAESQSRFHLVFQKFVQVFTSAEHPLVIFLDDLQWADLPTLNLTHSLMSDPKNQYLMVIGAYRDNEVDDQHLLTMALENIRAEGIITNTIQVTALRLEDIKHLLRDTLYSDLNAVAPLAELCIEKTQGNPFFLNQFLLGLHHNSQIFLNPETGKWMWDMEKIGHAEITDNVVEFMTKKIRGLSQQLPEILPYAACIGSHFDLQTISALCKKSMAETAEELWLGLQSGLIVALDNCYQLPTLVNASLIQNFGYRFLHDRVQQAAYELLPEEAAQRVHLKLGRILLENNAPTQQQEKLFDLVNHWNCGEQFIVEEKERKQLAWLNLAAGKKAKLSAAFESAFHYFSRGLKQIRPHYWQSDYSLCLELYCEAAQAAYLSGHLLSMEKWNDVILENAATTLDAVRAYEIRINAFITQGALPEAINVSLEILKKLGVSLPQSSNNFYLLYKYLEVKWPMSQHSVASLAELPELSDPIQLAILRLLSQLYSPAYLTKRDLVPLIILATLKITLRYGNNAYSPFAFAAFAMVEFRLFGNVTRCVELCKLGLLLQSQRSEMIGSIRVKYVYFSMASALQNHAHESLAPLREIYRQGIEAGDLVYAGYSSHNYSFSAYTCGRPLPGLYTEMQQFLETMELLKQDLPVKWLGCLLQTIANLMGENTRPTRLIGKYYNIETTLPEKIEAGEKTGIFLIYYNQFSLYFWLRDFAQAQQTAALSKKYIDKLNSSSYVVTFYMFDSLAGLALYADASYWQKAKILKTVSTNQRIVNKWAREAPMNYRHKWFLVKAELARVQRNPSKAMYYYAQAILGARENEFLQEEALANELYARFWLALEQHDFADLYLRKSYHLYQLWGARAKVKQLRNEFPALQVQKIAQGGPELGPLKSNLISSQTFDIAAVMKASQAISSEIQLSHLLKSLITICVENAAAQNGLLLLKRDNKWFIEAENSVAGVTQVLQSTQLTQATQLAKSIVQYTIKTQDPIVVGDASEDERFAKDPYIIRQQPKSIICIPILHHGKLDGILYMENNLSAHTFTPERFETLQLLASQAAISIENARWYAKHMAEKESEILQQKEIHRLKQKAIDALKENNQLKDDFLHVISHDLRSPLHGINGSLSLALNERMSQDSKHLLGVAQTASFDLLSIIDKILFFSELQAGKVDASLNEVVVENLVKGVIIKHQNLAASKHLALSFNILPGISKAIQVDQTKLIYIVEEFICNALNFTESGKVTLDVTLANDNAQVLCISVRDTGPGIEKNIRENIFEPFHKADASFRRKVGGLGIGLSVSQQLARVMEGSILVTSKVSQGSCFTLRIPYRPIENEKRLLRS